MSVIEIVEMEAFEWRRLRSPTSARPGNETVESTNCPQEVMRRDRT